MLIRLVILPLDRSHREHSIPLIGSFIIYPPQVGIVMLGSVITGVVCSSSCCCCGGGTEEVIGSIDVLLKGIVVLSMMTKKK